MSSAAADHKYESKLLTGRPIVKSSVEKRAVLRYFIRSFRTAIFGKIHLVDTHRGTEELDRKLVIIS